MFNFLYQVRKETYRGTEFKTRVWKRDPLFYVLFLVPFLAGIVFAFRWNLEYWAWYTCIGSFVVAAISAPFLRRVSPDALGVRQIGGYSCFTNCVVWAPPYISNYVQFPGSQETFVTADPKGEESKKILVQMGQGDVWNSGNPAGVAALMPAGVDETRGRLVTTTKAFPAGHPTKPGQPDWSIPPDRKDIGAYAGPLDGGSDEQLVVIRGVYILDLDKPWALIQAYFQEFIPQENESINEAMKRALKGKVEGDIIGVLGAVADEVLQDFYVKDAVSQVSLVNPYLLQRLDERLADIAADVIFAAIEATHDVRPGGFIERQSEGANALREGKARETTARADKAAGIAEQASQKAIAEGQILALDKKIQVQDRLAKMQVRVLVRRLEALSGSDARAAALVGKIESMDGEQVVQLVGNIADGMPNLDSLTVASLGGLEDIIAGVLNP